MTKIDVRILCQLPLAWRVLRAGRVLCRRGTWMIRSCPKRRKKWRPWRHFPEPCLAPFGTCTCRFKWFTWYSFPMFSHAVFPSPSGRQWYATSIRTWTSCWQSLFSTRLVGFCWILLDSVGFCLMYSHVPLFIPASSRGAARKSDAAAIPVQPRKIMENDGTWWKMRKGLQQGLQRQGKLKDVKRETRETRADLWGCSTEMIHRSLLIWPETLRSLRRHDRHVTCLAFRLVEMCLVADWDTYCICISSIISISYPSYSNNLFWDKHDRLLPP